MTITLGFINYARTRLFPGDMKVAALSLSLQSIFGVITLYIYRSTYELFKYYLMEPSKDASPHSKEDTIDDMRVAQQRHLGRSGAEISNTESDKKDTRLWDQIVTDLPIQVQVVRAESSVNTDLVVRDRTFPGYRT